MNQKRILLIDDEPSITRSMKTNLERTGNYIVHTENESTRGLAAARTFRPDIIFLDLMMPEMDGSELAGKLRADHDLGKIPVIFLTAIVSKAETGEQGMISGGNKFIAKPMSLAALTACIEDNTPVPASSKKVYTTLTEANLYSTFATSQI